MRVKGNWMDFIFFINNRKNCSESTVKSISFHDKLNIRNSMSEDRSRDECLLERIESITIGGVYHMQVHPSRNNVPTVKPPPNHTSLPSTVATFLATCLMAVLQPSRYSYSTQSSMTELTLSVFQH